eukprot:Clim_evm57s153 gene=Clim_evmTU57s153
MAVLTVRVIKSFEYRTFKNIVLQNIDLENTTGQALLDQAKEWIQTKPGFGPYKNVKIDTLKIHHIAHGAKTSNPIINLDKDEELTIRMDATLASCGVENETEISAFDKESYVKYKQHPEHKW